MSCPKSLCPSPERTTSASMDSADRLNDSNTDDTDSSDSTDAGATLSY